MTAQQGADGIDDEGAGADREWVVDAQIDAELARVRAGGVTRWFVADAPLPGDIDTMVCDVEPSAWPRTPVVRVEGRLGLLVPRCEGGLLVDALRKRKGMDPSLALGVLDEALEVLDSAPPAPRGASRTAMRGFAVDGRGGIVVLPGRLRDAASRTDSAELGELLHLALTGSTWEETGLPLALFAPEVPVAVTALVTELLEGDIRDADRTRLRARIAALEPSRDRGFLPAEPDVPFDAAPTGTLGADVVSALRGTRSGGPQPEVSSGGAPGVRSRRSSSRTRRDERKRRGVRARERRVRLRTVCMIVLCCTGVIAGVGLMVRGATGEAPPVQRTDSTAVQTPEPEPSARRSAASAEGPPVSTADDPLTAVVELSRLRAEAFADADGEALARLTVPRSPAATADAELDLDGCEDCADAAGGLEISDVHTAAGADAPDDTEGAGRADAAAQDPGTAEGDGGGPPVDGERAHVGATMRTRDSAPQQVVFVLERHLGAWRVHSVRAA